MNLMKGFVWSNKSLIKLVAWHPLKNEVISHATVNIIVKNLMAKECDTISLIFSIDSPVFSVLCNVLMFTN